MVKHQNHRDAKRKERALREYRYEVLRDAIDASFKFSQTGCVRWPQDGAYRKERARAGMYDTKTLENKTKVLRERAA